jgi:hypothetical protein
VSEATGLPVSKRWATRTKPLARRPEEHFGRLNK